MQAKTMASAPTRCFMLASRTGSLREVADKRNARMLARYNKWANELIYTAVAALPPGEATKPRQTLFKSIVHTLNHIYVIDRIFQAHLEGRPHGYLSRNTAEHPPLPELLPSQPLVHCV